MDPRSLFWFDVALKPRGKLMLLYVIPGWNPTATGEKDETNDELPVATDDKGKEGDVRLFSLECDVLFRFVAGVLIAIPSARAVFLSFILLF
jgi:hypothetical protein